MRETAKNRPKVNTSCLSEENDLSSNFFYAEKDVEEKFGYMLEHLTNVRRSAGKTFGEIQRNPQRLHARPQFN